MFLSAALRSLGFLLVPVVAAAFSVNGSFPALPRDTPVVLSRLDPVAKSSTVLVSTRLDEAGRFTLTAAPEAGLFEIEVGSQKRLLALAGGERVELTPGNDGIEVVGAPHQGKLEAYERFRRDSLARLVYPVRAELKTARGAGDEALVERLTEREVSAYAAHRRELNDFTLAEIGASPALLATALRWDGDYRRAELAAQVAAFQEAFPGSPAGGIMAARIARFESLAIGAVAPALEGPGPEGETLALADFRGRWVLLDFWASWCPPCRIENRHYTQLYQRFHDAGFEIFAVSVDQQAAGWKRAIRQDGADWVHVSDLSGWQTPLAAAYGVSALPASFLLDPAGRIVAKDLRGEALAAKLAEVFGQP